MTKAKIRIEDIGGLRGEYTFEFERGELNSIEGSNSGGKSSIIQALTAALSIPQDCDLDSFYRAEAIKLGVKTDISSAKEGFVHVLAREGRITVVYDNTELQYAVDSKGTPLQCSDGNPGFLVSGVLSNRSKVIRQLRGQDDRHEPDDFRWAVTELSLAKRYEDVLNLLKEKRDDAKSINTLASKKRKDNESLRKKQSQLRAKKDTIESEIARLKEEYGTVSKTLSEIQDLRRKRSEVAEKVSKETAELKHHKSQSKREEKRLDQLRELAAQKKNDYERIDLKKIKEETENQRQEAQNEISRLMKERDAIDGVLNLFVVAESSIDRKGTTCPLCEKGHLTYDEVSTKVGSLRTQKDELSSRIGHLNLTSRQKRKHLEDKSQEKQDLRDEYEEARIQVKEVETSFDSHSSVMSNLEFNIREGNQQTEQLDKEIAELSEKIGKGSKKAQQEYLKREKQGRAVSDELAVTNQMIYETAVEIGMKAYQPHVAERIAKGWLDLYNDLIEYTSSMAENQRIKAAEQFNSTIKGLMDRLDFKEFRTVMLNQDYRLYVERFDEKKKDYVFQQVKTLSTSEQMSVALILQVALKETYLPHIPFLLIDDIMEDFDEQRREEVLAYLKEKAQENEWYIISTRLVKGLDGIRVV